ncbi:VOC family protein [Paenibacillus aurantius]|uniref:VOC family protein n=1 Tax=Paenibacillus aurantius TaxID=2918900 RepID=A0AA96REW7_9BACL|nr:VOC family protein [Paenibacillus aurantius]WNQ12910.1 VOC family protein [Paenibacillus aurantius]
MRITELELRTARLAEMKEFYTERLGFALAAITEHSITIVAGGTRLTFVHEEEGRILPSYHLAMNIPENQIHDAKSWLLAKGCQVLSAEPLPFAGIQANEDIAYFEGTDAHALYFEDPSGNLVEFIARHRMDNASTEPFDHESILNVSEIGFPLRGSISEAIQRLDSRFDVTPYIGDGKTFQMLGDDHGMFILGDRAIGWYPSMVIPEVHPILMTILDPQEGEFQLDPYPYFIRAVSERPV